MKVKTSRATVNSAGTIRTSIVVEKNVWRRYNAMCKKNNIRMSHLVSVLMDLHEDKFEAHFDRIKKIDIACQDVIDFMENKQVDLLSI